MSDETPKQPTGEHRTVSGEFRAVHDEARSWGLAHMVAGAVGAVLSTGGAVVFLVAYAGNIEAKAESRSIVATTGLVTVQAQRLDVLKGDVDVVKLRLEAVDAGVARAVEGLRNEVREANRRSEARADAQEQLLREIARGMKRREDIR